jgi:tetratricopeptide (TPR) repeat protein
LGAQSHEALQRAAALVQEGRLDEADRQARLALSDPDTRPVAQSILGAIRLQQDRLEEGAALLEEAIRLEPGLLGAHLTLAQVYTLQGRADRALQVFRRVLERDPSNARARIALAGAAAAKGNYAQSLELARPALGAFEQSPEGLVILATSYLNTKDRDSAARMADKWRRLTDVPPAASVRFAHLLAEGGLVA